MRRALVCFACVLLPIVLDALVLPLSPADIERALDIARGPASSRAAFTAQYVFPLEETAGSVTVERLEIVTPFRHAELFGEDRLRIGDHMFSARDATAALGADAAIVTVRAQLRFNPLNVLVTVPDYAIVIGNPANGEVVPPERTTTTPIFGGPPARGRRESQPIMGATIETSFEAAALHDQTWPVGVWLGDEKIAAVAVRFGEIQ
jgi:hypothetical protein